MYDFILSELARGCVLEHEKEMFACVEFLNLVNNYIPVPFDDVCCHKWHQLIFAQNVLLWSLACIALNCEHYWFYISWLLACNHWFYYAKSFFFSPNWLNSEPISQFTEPILDMHVLIWMQIYSHKIPELWHFLNILWHFEPFVC